MEISASHQLVQPRTDGLRHRVWFALLI
jgi:hypothetical protein